MEDKKTDIIEFNVSHDARLCVSDLQRTFVGDSVADPVYRVVGNIYKKVKDPNMVGALSGHKEGNQAFTRYRNIDDDMKREMIGFLE